MNNAVKRKPLPLSGGHDQVLLHSCCVCALRDTNRQRFESKRARIQLGVKVYGNEGPAKNCCASPGARRHPGLAERFHGSQSARFEPVSLGFPAIRSERQDP